MKMMKLKKLVVACQAAAITTVTSVAVSTQASDVELYKAPQTSETTLMFMLDVSGSMKPDSNNYKENRIQSLKDGMTTLLQGDSSKGIAPLEDKLIVGLSTFNSNTGRIKLEAKPLGEPVQLAGNREVFRTVQQVTQPVQRTISRSKTDLTWQERVRVRTRSCFIWCGNWSDWTEPNWSNKSSNGTWSSWSNPNWGGAGSEIAGSTIAQECVDWNTNYTCKANGWVATTKQAEDFVGTIPVTQTGNITYSNQTNVSSDSKTTESDLVSRNETVSTNTREENTLTRNGKSTTTTETIKQEATASFSKNTVYTGAAYETHRKKMLREVNSLSADGGTPTAFAYAEVAAYLLGRTTKGQSGSGFNESVIGNIRDADKYNNPTQIDRSKQCNTQGIYFLTDGVPEYNLRTSSAESAMQSALDDTSYTCSATDLNPSSGYFYNDREVCVQWNSRGNCIRTAMDEVSTKNWQCIAGLTKRLKSGTIDANGNPVNNPQGVNILTAVVGFGSTLGETTGSYKNDVTAAKAWGDLGGGGYYSGSNDKAVVDSVNAFIHKLGKYIPPVTTGSVTIPVDALDTQNIQPWGYFPQFDPKPNAIGNTGVVTWLGNLKKFKVAEGVLYDRDSSAVANSSGLLKDDINDYWADTSVKKWIEKEENGVKQSLEVKVGGALSRMLLGYNTAQTPNERRIFTDRALRQNATDNSQNDIISINSGNLIQVGRADFISSSQKLYKQDPKRGYLLSLFGYPIAKDLAYNLDLYPKEATFQSELEQVIQQQPKRDWLMGAVMHSRPILLTQEGTTAFEKDVLTYTNRDDLVLFGTTQGVLHVVTAGKDATDGNGGKEVFTFVPNEMVENQAKGFLSQDNQAANLQYGIDGQWTAYTEYVTKSSSIPKAPVVTVKGGKQWVYGGLRMGGKSYYALDLSDVTSTGGTPKLKFRINPTGSCSTSNPLGCMGQSWSKPTIAWVNWQGQRKLVMFVGGGYDPRYEADINYSPSGTDQGAGVYMFDADNGDLLWWASANAGSNSTNKTYNKDLNRSVVSSIKTVDRNSDGIADHLYFGDLGGQVWRIDLSSSTNAGKTGGDNFATRAVRLLDMSGTDAPRFYSTPTFTIHNSNNGLFAAITIGSGNFSYPMSAKNNDKDAVYVIYDKDVTRRNLPILLNNELYTYDVKVNGTTGRNLVNNVNGNTETTLANGGWYYSLGSKKRILNDHVAIDNDLYVSVFDAAKDIEGVDCAGGVRGESKVSQFCLPYGQCTKTGSSGAVVEDRPDDIFLGKGNIGISFGGINQTRNMVLNLPTSGNIKKYTGKTQFVSQRWYER
ncbi:PilC/PilY family type IV pilus protein [Acinetobacter gyllenbergii]|uniref:PilC/PilY family type IV pilus protein n=1 Tax=Acinetobacter gyllenbergii TaxID=134534 RepID=UPI000806C46C|nr:PilC/PilY family type IV pilus protein [Acinetobacter gyllenbergii]OBY74284.1 pilus assembly protein PilY [Acinetobacter gyllenbergii]